ncbi:MAG: ATP-binding protein [Gaiellaceae bacterium]
MHVSRREAARDIDSAVTVRLPRDATAPSLARRHVQGELAAPLSGESMNDIALLTSEVVTNVVEHSSFGDVEVTVLRAEAFTRIEVSNPGQSWQGDPQARRADVDEVGGWGLFLVEQLSDRWGTTDKDATVWFEIDHPGRGIPIDEVWQALQHFSYPATRQCILDMAIAGHTPMTIVARLEGLRRERYENAEEVSLDLVVRRAEGNTALVSLTPRDQRSFHTPVSP